MVHYGAMILNKGATIQVNHTILLWVLGPGKRPGSGRLLAMNNLKKTVV